MRVLIINKFLHPNGGAESYIFQLGDVLKKNGHEVQYFGMEHENSIVGNRINVCTSHMDFHNASLYEKLTYPVRTIYSSEARKKLRLVLEDFCPDVCHLNNFNYQLTPSVILEIRAWEKRKGRTCKIVYTAHDYQLVCPNHMCRNPGTGENCEKCFGGHFWNCVRGKCIHGSLLKSAVGAAEGFFWNKMAVYRQIDTIICCSRFLKSKLDSNPVLAEKTEVLHNFVEAEPSSQMEKEDYVLYVGRYSREKGLETLVKAAEQLPDISIVTAGSGPLEERLEGISNLHNVGFQSGEQLKELIRKARFTVYPSEWYENCPFSVLESLALGTPVLGADIGGIPELIRAGETGELFESGNAEQLRDQIRKLWDDPERRNRYAGNCREQIQNTPEQYLYALMKVYEFSSERTV